MSAIHGLSLFFLQEKVTKLLGFEGKAQTFPHIFGQVFLIAMQRRQRANGKEAERPLSLKYQSLWCAHDREKRKKEKKNGDLLNVRVERVWRCFRE